MDVVLVGVDFLEQKIGVVVLDVLDSSQDEGLDAFVDNLASVFGRKHNVIVTDKDTVRFTAIDGWHSPMIRHGVSCYLGRQLQGGTSSHGLTAGELRLKY